MIDQNLQLLSIFVLTIFLCSVLMHIVRRNSSSMLIFSLQSAAVSALLLILGINEGSIGLITFAILTFLIKSIGTPIALSKIISQKQLATSTTTYLSLPISLGIILIITMLVKSNIFAPIIGMVPYASQLITFSLSGVLISLFLLINKRGVFSQLIGILSFENGLVAFTALVGIEQTFAIEVGILFDITLWMMISSVLIKMIYTHFGSLNTGGMNRLKD